MEILPFFNLCFTYREGPNYKVEGSRHDLHLRVSNSCLSLKSELLKAVARLKQARDIVSTSVNSTTMLTVHRSNSPAKTSDDQINFGAPSIHSSRDPMRELKDVKTAELEIAVLMQVPNFWRLLEFVV